MRNRRGKTLVEIAQELETIQQTAVDHRVPIQQMHAQNAEGELKVGFDGNDFSGNYFALNNFTSGQVAQYADIPTKYFRKLQAENPSLLAGNVNHAFDRNAELNKGKTPEIRTLRTFEKDGVPTVRGFVSGKYKRRDNYDLVNMLVPLCQDQGLEVIECNLDQQKFYLKAVSNRLITEVKKGDVVRWGVAFSNSDVGAGSTSMSKFIDRCFCDNGMFMPDVQRSYHVGRHSGEDDLSQVLSEQTLSLDEQAFWSKLRDVTVAALNPDNFEVHVNRLREAAMLPIKSIDPGAVVSQAMRLTGVTGEGKQQSIIAALASGNEGAGLTKWGLMNSFTRAAKNDAWAYEESQELERAAGKILDLGKEQWEVLAS